MSDKDQDFKSIYERIEKGEKAVQVLDRNLYAHLQVADLIEGNDKEKIEKLTESIEKLSTSIADSDYVKSSELEKLLEPVGELSKSITAANYVTTAELTELLRPIVDSLNKKISLYGLVGVASIFSAIITVVVLVVLKSQGT